MFNFDDYTKAFENYLSKTPFNYDEIMKSTNENNSKFAKIAFNSAQKNLEISQAWAKETLIGLKTFSNTQPKPDDFLKASTDYITEQAQKSPKYLAEFAEIAKKTQLETIELLMSVSKEAKDGMSKATQPKKTT